MNYIDLHLHLDGSQTAQSLLEIARADGVPLPARTAEELEPLISVTPDCTSLNDYLDRFALPLTILQSARALETAAYNLMLQLKEKGLLYAEIRFAPSLHGRNGLSQEGAVQAALAGVRRGTEVTGLPAQLILCAMRAPQSAERDASYRETVRLAASYLGRGVCCFDLAGAEALWPNTEFADLFAYGRELGVPFVVHAGEAAGPESVRAAVEAGARRIGHGVTAVQDSSLLPLLRERGVTVEVCVTSNLHTRAVLRAEDHPLRQLLEAGVPVCLNTDNMTVSHTDMAAEFALARSALGLTESEIALLQRNAVQAAFLPEAEKAALLTALGL